MKKKSIFNWALLVCVLGLALVCFMSIYNDIAFDNEKKAREALVISKLMQVRDAQEKFRLSHGGQFCSDIDSLIDWVKNEKAVDKVVKEGDLTDEQLEAGMTEKEAVAQGLIKRDTVYVAAYELLGITCPDSLKLIPVGKEGAVIEMATDSRYNTKSQEYDNLCEIRARLDDYMDGTDAKQIKGLKNTLKERGKNRVEFSDPEGETEWYGLRIGDLEDPNNKLAGNWE